MGKLLLLNTTLKFLSTKEIFKSASIKSVFSKFKPGLKSQFFISFNADLNSLSV